MFQGVLENVDVFPITQDTYTGMLVRRQCCSLPSTPPRPSAELCRDHRKHHCCPSSPSHKATSLVFFELI